MSLNKKKETSHGVSTVPGMNELIISDVISHNENKSCGCALGETREYGEGHVRVITPI